MFSAKTHIREERSRNATFPNINKHLVYPHWYQCFQTGWESRKQGGGESVVLPVPRFYKLGGSLGFYYHLGANIQPGVLWAGGRVAMTEIKRKPGPDKPRESTRETREAATWENEKASERQRGWERQRVQRKKEKGYLKLQQLLGKES